MEPEKELEEIEPQPTEEAPSRKYVYLTVAVFFVALLLFGASWWLFFKAPSLPEQPLVATTTPSVDQTKDTETVTNTNTNNQTDTTEASKTYRNDEWKFAFEYPSDWKIRTPAFGSAVSLFNLAIDPIDKHNAEIVVLNITPKDWIDKALIKMRARGVVVENTTFSGRVALRISDKDGLGRPATITLVLINDEYWIDITGIKQYEEEYNQILQSFVFLDMPK